MNRQITVIIRIRKILVKIRNNTKKSNKMMRKMSNNQNHINNKMIFFTKENLIKKKSANKCKI